MNEMVPGLTGSKMSASDPNSKIDFLDPPEVVRKKIKGAFCEEGNTEQNGVLAFVKSVLIPISELRIERKKTGEALPEGTTGDQIPFITEGAPEGTVFTISRPEKFGGPSHYSSYSELHDAFAKKEVHPGDLKNAVTDALTRLLEPIRQEFLVSEGWQKVLALAYPEEQKPVKKKKVNCLCIMTEVC